MTDTLHDELDAAFGSGPAHRPVEVTLGAGRRALRRRRVSALAGAVAVAAVLGTGFAVSSPGGQGRSTSEIAADPSPMPSPTSVPAVDEEWSKGEVVRYADDGTLQVRPGVEVHERIENPYDFVPPERSDALDLTFRGQRTWAILTLDRAAGEEGLQFGASMATPSNGWADFAHYVADQVSVDRGGSGAPSGWPGTLRLTAEGEVVPTSGTEVLQRTDDPRLGDRFAPPGVPTGAALLRAGEERRELFVVWRVEGGVLEVVTTPIDDPSANLVGATFAELLSWARGQYASGEGLR
ncbi:hypothetical protein [Nocardioides ferulae]|uniref:hypothetical protein n=1 Tax=Nocardioides ferulae TaxID=2340821 RepID=UPI000EB2D95C|nr:hypothetical protein [Nocardioides ferulae]